ncbi:MAG: hypothetical protein WCH10_07000, partial [bacterium]
KYAASSKIIYRKDVTLPFAVGLLNYRKLLGKPNNIGFLERPYYLYRTHNLTQRISLKNICEKEMLRRTINLYPEIFKIHYPEKSEGEIIHSILSNKKKQSPW